MTDMLGKNYVKGNSGIMKHISLSENVENGHTYPLFCIEGDRRFSPESSEPKAQYPFIGIGDIGKSMDTLSQFHHNIPAVSDYSCCNVEEPVSQSLDEPLFIYARQCQSLNPVDDVVSQHSYGQICPVCMKLLTGESIKRKSVFCLFDEVFHSGSAKMKGDKFLCRLSPVGDDYMIPIFCSIKNGYLFFLRQFFPACKKTILTLPAVGFIIKLCNPYIILYLYPLVFRDGMDSTHQGNCLVGSDAETDVKPFTLSDNLFVVKTRVHAGIDCIGKVFDLMVAFPYKADCSFGCICVTGAESALCSQSPFSLIKHTIGFNALMPVYVHFAPSFLLP